MKVILANMDNTHEEIEVDDNEVYEVGVICRPDLSYSTEETIHVESARFYRFSGLDGKFMSKPIFAEVKMLVVQ